MTYNKEEQEYLYQGIKKNLEKMCIDSLACHHEII